MKAKCHHSILWSVLSLCLLSCALHAYEYPFNRRKRGFKPSKQSATEDRRSSTSPLCQLRSRRPYPPRTPRSTPRPGEPESKLQSDFASLPDVSVTCSTIDFVVRVKPYFYGLGADAEELKLGSNCRSNGVLRPDGDLLFTYPLTSCDAVRESPCGYLLYKFVLHYEPSPKRVPRGAHRINVDIECHYQRDHHVYQLAVQPTWETAVVSKRLKGSPSDFQVALMDDSWSRPVKSNVYQIGRTINFQVSAPHLSTGGKLYINTCYATSSSGSESPLKYAIIDNFGCMSDSKSNPGASRFISRTDGTLRFSFHAFQFTLDPDAVVNIHCNLFVISEDPGPTQKSCTYTGDRWKALTGDDSVCKCCDSQCVSSKPRRALMEGSASSGSLLVSDQPYTAEDGFAPVGRESGATINPYNDELKSHENLWDLVKNDDEEQDYADDNDDEEQDHADHEEDNEFIFGVMTEPDLHESGFRERVFVEEKKESEANDLNQSEEDGSEYVAQKDSEEKEMNLDRKEADMLQLYSQRFPSDSLQRGLQMLVSEGEEEESRRHTGSGEEDDWLMASEVERKNDDSLADLAVDGEMTWYFPWG